MDLVDNFATKEKIDLIEMAISFNVLTPSKAHRMSKKNLVEILSQVDSQKKMKEISTSNLEDTSNLFVAPGETKEIKAPPKEVRRTSSPKKKLEKPAEKQDKVSVKKAKNKASPKENTKDPVKDKAKEVPPLLALIEDVKESKENHVAVLVEGAILKETSTKKLAKNQISLPAKDKVEKKAVVLKAKPKMEVELKSIAPKLKENTKIETKPKTEIKLKAEMKSGVEAESKSKIETKPKAELKPKIGMKAKVKVEPKTEITSRVEIKPKVETGTKVENEKVDRTRIESDEGKEGRNRKIRIIAPKEPVLPEIQENASHRQSHSKNRSNLKKAVLLEPKSKIISDPEEKTKKNELNRSQNTLEVKDSPLPTSATSSKKTTNINTEIHHGTLEIVPDGYGFLRKDNYLQGQNDIFVPNQYIRRFNLRNGDYISGPCRAKRDNDRYQAIQYIKEVNGLPPDKMIKRPHFDSLVPIYPQEKFILETEKTELSTRIIDLIAPIGKGQRGMIVSPPKAGKTILMQKIANAISINNPEAKLIVLLIDERPEEVTDMQRSIKGEVVYSTFDKTPEHHVKIVELVLERAMRLVELGQDVVILLDSITRLARAYNLTINPTGRTLSGGLDPGALYGPKRFFGAARNIENGGSLTVVATSLIDTGSRMDEVIFEEFKGTGNMEVYLDRKLSEKRIFPAIDINKSSTRREELLLLLKELDAVWSIRKAFSQADTAAVTEMIISLLLKTNNNNQFVQSVNVSFNDKALFEAMRGTRTSHTNGGNNGNGNNS